MDKPLVQQFRNARRVSTPLITIRTADPAATVKAIINGLNGNVPAIVEWDMVRNLVPLNEAGTQAMGYLLGDDPGMAGDIIGLLAKAATAFPEKGIFILHNAHRLAGEGCGGGSNPALVQAIWNLRDKFKQNFRQLVLLCPDINLPAELTNDMLVLDEPLPDAGQLSTIITDVYEASEVDPPDDETLRTAVNATAGLAAFPAEQVMAMSMTPSGVDISGLWERKRQQIEQQKGLSVWRGGEVFDDIAGVANIKSFLQRLASGPEAPQVVVLIDEIEKSMGNHEGDTSGVKADTMRTLLADMEDHKALGIIAVGVPGGAKSFVAKAAGTEMGGLTIAMDLGGMRGSLVGESEQQLRQALKTIWAIGQGRVLFLATCNSIAVLPPELKRRFKLGTFFFDLPNEDERDAIWKLYVTKYHHFFLDVEPPKPNDDGWTGAEIAQCCEIAYRLNTTLIEAAKYIVPVSRSSSDQIEKLRTSANGRFISASYEGFYRYEKHAPSAEVPAGRSISFD